MINKVVVHQAISFYNAYINLDRMNNSRGGADLIYPVIVNGVFSIELALKAILINQSIDYSKDHILAYLFEKLPTDVQNTVWEFVAEKTPVFADKKRHDEELLVMSNAFSRWRYAFEESVPSLDLVFLSSFANAIIRTMFSLGYNIALTESDEKISIEEAKKVDEMIARNRQECIDKNEEHISQIEKRAMKREKES